MAEFFYRTATLESIAREALKRYDPTYLNQDPQAVPIERIIEDIYKISIEYMRLTESGDELGRMICDDGYSTRFNVESDSYELVEVTEGTMLIESLLVNNPKAYGRYRFTLAHELGHWLLHKHLYKGTGILLVNMNAPIWTELPALTERHNKRMAGSFWCGRTSPKARTPDHLPLNCDHNNKHGYITIGYRD